MKLSLYISTTSPLALLAIACYFVSASSLQTSKTPKASVLPYPVRTTQPLSVFLHASPLLEGAVGHRKHAFDIAHPHFAPLHHDFFDPTSKIAMNEKVTVAYQEISKDLLPNPSRFMLSFNSVQPKLYPSSSEKVNTAKQTWILAEHYFNTELELTNLCPRQHDSTVRRDDILEVEIPFICSVWNGFVSLMQSGKIERPQEPLSLHKSLVLISNLPWFLRVKRHPKIRMTVYDSPTSANIAYVAIPYYWNPSRPTQYVATTRNGRIITPDSGQTPNMLRLWMVALQGIQAEAERLHQENDGDLRTSPVEISISIHWSKSAMISGSLDGNPLPDPVFELALKFLAVKLAGGVHSIEVFSDEPEDRNIQMFTDEALSFIKGIGYGWPIYMAADRVDGAYEVHQRALEFMKQSPTKGEGFSLKI